MGQQRDCKSTIERAFELAGEEHVTSMDQLIHHLQKEGYSTNMLTGPLLLKQLRGRLGASPPAP